MTLVDVPPEPQVHVAPGGPGEVVQHGAHFVELPREAEAGKEPDPFPEKLPVTGGSLEGDRRDPAEGMKVY